MATRSTSSPLEEGDILPGEAVDHPSIADKIRREGGVIHVTLLFPIRANAPEAARFQNRSRSMRTGPCRCRQTETDMTQVKIDWSQRVREAEQEALRQANAARRTLAETDWYVIRQIETGQPIPANITSARAAARKTAGEPTR